MYEWEPRARPTENSLLAGTGRRTTWPISIVGLSPRPGPRDIGGMPIQPSLRPPRVSRETRLTAVIVASALFMQNLDSTIIATALRAMARAFGDDPVRRD